jgi:hypothetical protein
MGVKALTFVAIWVVIAVVGSFSVGWYFWGRHK